MGTVAVADPDLLDTDNPPQYLESVNELTEWYNAQLEKFIRLSPEQYWWLHRRWREVPAAQLRRIAKRRAKKQQQRSAA